MKQKLVLLYALALLALLAASCGRRISPKPGHWKAYDPLGYEKASFDVDDNGNIQNFKFIFHWRDYDEQCIVELEELDVQDNTFTWSEDSWEPRIDLAVTGEFDSEITLTGTYKPGVCTVQKDDGTYAIFYSLAKEVEWTAEWVGP